MNDLFKMTFYFLQVVLYDDNPVNPQGMNVIFQVLYVLISKG
jgi:hypothetical protein